MRAIDRWRRLTRDQKFLVVRAAVEIAAMAVGMRVFGIKRMLPAAEGAEQTATDCTDYTDLVQAIDRAGPYVPGATCLTRSLALTRLLRGRGIVAETKIGVKTASGFHAHAWVEVGGVPITPPEGRPLPSPAR